MENFYLPSTPEKHITQISKRRFACIASVSSQHVYKVRALLHLTTKSIGHQHDLHEAIVNLLARHSSLDRDVDVGSEAWISKKRDLESNSAWKKK